jgi:hypothetical protein
MMVSLTIPMFLPLNACKNAIGTSDETPNESWVRFKDGETVRKR